MKYIYVLRHAEKGLFGNLTKKGEEHCQILGKTLPHFSLIISSESPRTIQTAQLLTNIFPEQDHQANIEYDSGAELVELIKETVKNLKPNNYALIVSHAPAVKPAYLLLQSKIPNQVDISFAPLTGFIVDEKMNVVLFQ